MKPTYSPILLFTYSLFKKCAFTLAEVLITLGIIGVVAALTLPSLIQAHKRVEVAAKLKQIYSVMNQAILMSERDNGSKEYWTYCTWGEEGECTKKFFETYLLPYIKYTKYTFFQSYGGTNIAIYFANGSILTGKLTNNGGDFFFITNGKYFNSDTFTDQDDDGTYLPLRKGTGSSIFPFAFYPIQTDKYHNRKGFEPYMLELRDYNEEELKNNGKFGCYTASQPNYCTALIQYNGWTFPKDYPYQVK